MNTNDKCPYCGCDIEDHPNISFPLGSVSCCGCGGCPLLSDHVKKILSK